MTVKTMRVLGLLLFLGLEAGWADVVYLKNGRSLEGTVVKETETQITIDLGLGTMTFHQSKVDRIERSSAKEQAAFQEENRKKNILSKPHIPAGYQELVRDFETIYAERTVFMDLQERLRGYDGAMDRMSKTARSLEAQISRSTRHINQLGRDRSQIRDYNQQIEAHNKLVNQATHLRKQQQGTTHRAYADAQLFMERVKDLGAFQTRLDQLRTESDPENADVQLMFEQLVEKYEAMLAEFGPEWKHRPSGDYVNLHAIVKVELNGAEAQSMVVDSGASAVVISREAAGKLGLDLEDSRAGLTQVADGRYVRSYHVDFDTVRVGDHVAENVKGIVIDGGMSGNGLLGMTFLTRFNWRIDPATSEFIIDSKAD